MDSNNTFQGGMNSDISKLFQNPNTYLKAVNFRPVTDSGNSVAALTNIRGNECEITFPNIRGVYKIGIKPHDTGNQTGTITLTINGQTTPNLVIDTNTRISEFVDSITSLINCYNNSSAINPTFAVAYNDEYITIFQQPEYSGCDSNSSTEPLISVNIISGTPEIVFIDSNDNESSSYTANTPSINGLPLYIIGSTFINEEIFLFTCPEPNNNETGQIWKMTYNELTKVTTLKLLYNNRLNFSVQYPIAPSAAIGRFELDTLKRIYWTDNNNYVRSCNVEDPNLMVFDIDLINLRPSIDMSVPVLDEILDGQAVNPIGTQTTYQCSYRLIKNNGAMTNYSPVSNLVYPLYVATSSYLSPQPNFCNIGFFSSTTNKAIKWTVDGIDTDFDTIEFVVIERSYPNNNDYTVFKFDSQPINGQEKISTIFRNPSDKEPITLEEFLLENSAFTHCKTIESKDNRLFFGNVRNDLDAVLESFDARTFRFNKNSTITGYKKFETDSNATFTNITSIASYTSIQEDEDDIPLYNLGMHQTDDPLYNKSYKYKRNSSVLGGEGANISYSFGSYLLETDAVVNEPVSQMPPNTASGNTLEGTDADNPTPVFAYNNGYRIPGIGSTSFRIPTYINNAPNQEYIQRNSRATHGIEYMSGLARTYQHNEIYRFGIIFRSKTGEESFVKWIGDIKFPDYSDPVDPALAGKTNNGTPCPDFRSIFLEGNSAYSVLPYIEFTVDIPADIASIVHSFEIVRVPRNSNDRTIAAQGLVNQVATGAGSESQNFFLPQSHPNVGKGQLALDPIDWQVTTNKAAAAYPYMLTYHPFEYIAGQNCELMEEDDRLIATEMYSSSKEAVVSPGSPALSGENLYYIKKYYTLNKFFDDLTMSVNPTSSNIFIIKQALYCPQGAETGQVFLGGTSIYKNYNYTLTNPNYTGNTYQQGAYSVGSQCIVVEVKPNAYSYSNPSGINTSWGWRWYDVFFPACSESSISFGSSKVLAIHYKPKKLESQYGGRTATKRAGNEYISTGAFYPLDGDSGTKTIKVFGGDVFHSILDIQRAIKNWNFVTVAPSGNKHSQTWYFPTQSIANADIRHGDFVNKNLRNDGTSHASLTDDYSYNWAYSMENTLKKYYPKPLFFNNTDTWNNRVYWSNVKINGETSDSWSTIPTNNYYDVEGAYGGINAFSILKNNFYFVQDRAFGSLLINPVASIGTTQGFPLQMGIGDTVQKHQYVSIDAGTQHQWSVFRSNNAITFTDVRHKKIYTYNGSQLEPISDTKGQKGFINKVLHDNILISDNPIIGNGILSTYDYLNNEFLYTFQNSYFDNSEGEQSVQYDNYTLVYSDLIGAFSGFYSFIPYIYINNHNKLYSLESRSTGVADSTPNIYMHNIGDYGSFYGTINPSYLKVNINSNPLYTKVFDNISWTSESVKEGKKFKDYINNYPDITFNGDSDDIPYLTDTFDQIRCYNEYQNTDWITLSTNPATRTLRKSEQGWNVQVPRNKVNYDNTTINTKSIFDPTILTKATFKDRLRDKYMIVDLMYPNDINNRFTIHNLRSTYRISPR